MALANIGVLMAAEGYRVLLVDWDLEAPGLEVFFRNGGKLVGDSSATPGVVDLLDAQAQGAPLPWRKCLLKAEFFGHSLDILSAGRRTDDYRRRVQQLDWATLFREHRIGNYINSLREEWRGVYEFVLIDSRTGITDIGDICTVILPDVLVLLFVTNYQNVEGIKSVMARATKARSKLPVNRSKLLGVPVPARDERDRESDKFKVWEAIFAGEFSELYREWLPKEITPLDALHRIYIPYIAGWSFGEQIPVLESERERTDPSSLGAAYARLATLLSHRLDWTAIEARASTADVLGARVELSKAREEARAAEMRLAEEARRHEEEVRLEEAKRREAELRLAQSQQAAARSKKHARILTWASAILFILTVGGGAWWYKTHPSAAQLVAQFQDSRASVRADAVDKLKELNSAAVPYAGAIATLLKDPNASVRANATEALTAIAIIDRQAAAKFAPDVAGLLKDNDSRVRGLAAKALGGMGGDGAKFVVEVAQLLKDQDAFVRWGAARGLGRMGKAAVQFAPDVAALLNDKESYVRDAATEALKEMGEERFLKQ
jgi:hypothetical protein